MEFNIKYNIKYKVSIEYNSTPLLYNKKFKFLDLSLILEK